MEKFQQPLRVPVVNVWRNCYGAVFNGVNGAKHKKKMAIMTQSAKTNGDNGGKCQNNFVKD